MIPGPGHYAGVVSRGTAFFIDFVLASIVCAGGFAFTRAMVTAFGVENFANGNGGALGYLLAVPFVFGLYCVVFWSLVGRTLGMMLLGLRVVTVDGRDPSLARSIVRVLGYWVSAIFFIGFAWIAIDRRRQGFHDKIAHTVVVYDWVVTADITISSTAASTL